MNDAQKLEPTDWYWLILLFSAGMYLLFSEAVKDVFAL
jgi:hypothetical protein